MHDVPLFASRLSSSESPGLVRAVWLILSDDDMSYLLDRCR